MREVGWGYRDVVDRLEKRKIEAQVFDNLVSSSSTGTRGNDVRCPTV
jgi:hypothetical protein